MALPRQAQAGTLDYTWPAGGYPEDMVRDGVKTRSALDWYRTNGPVYANFGMDRNFVWYSEVRDVPAGGVDGWYVWANGNPWNFVYTRNVVSYPNDYKTFAAFYWNATFVSQVCGNHGFGDWVPRWFSNPLPPYLTGSVWNDLDGDGTRDAGEPGIGGVPVKLTPDNGGYANTVTDASGYFRLNVDANSGNLPSWVSGNYSAVAAVPSGWVQTSGDWASNIGEGPGSANANYGGHSIGLRQIIPPSTSMTTSPSATPDGLNGWYKSPTTISFSTNQPSTTTTYRWNQGTPSTWPGSAVAALPGTNTVSYKSQNRFGDQEAETSAILKVDFEPPTAPVVSAVASSPTTISLSWTDSVDNTSGFYLYVLYKADGTQVATLTAPSYEVTGVLPGGRYGYYVKAMDRAGNVSQSDEQYVSTPLRPAPVTRLTVDPSTPNGSNSWYVTVPTLTLDGNADTIYHWSSSFCTTMNVCPPQPVLTDGESTLYWFGTKAYCESESLKSASFKVDTAAPSKVAVTTSPISLTSVLVSWSAAFDAHSGVAAYRLIDEDTGATLATTTANVTSATLSELNPRSTYNVVVEAIDVAGNVGVSSDVVSFVIDDRAPKTTLSTAPASPDGLAGWYVTEPEITLSVDETATTWVSVGTTMSVYSAPFVLADGQRQIWYRSIDEAGNIEGTQTASFKVDATDPLSWSDAAEAYVERAVIRVGGSDAGSGLSKIWMQLDSGAWTNDTTLTVTSLGRHKVNFCAEDIAGNRDATTTVSFVVNAQPLPADTTPPITKISDVPITWVRSDIHPVLTATDDNTGVDSTWYSIDGAKVIYSDPMTITAEGTTTITYWSVDKAGNIEDANTASAYIDKTPPTIPGCPGYSVLTESRVTLVWAPSTDGLSGLSAYEVLDDGVIVATVTTNEATFSVEAGSTHHYSVRAIDVAGNVSAPSDVSIIDVPTTSTETSVTAGESISVTLTVPVIANDRDHDHHAGGDNDLELAQATFTITDVTVPGVLTVSRTDTPPANPTATFKFTDDFYDVTFSGTFKGTITVTLPYDPFWPDSATKGFFIGHYVNGKYEHVPVTVDTVNHTVTAVLNSLSPLILMVPEDVDTTTRIITARTATSMLGRPVTLSAKLVDASSTPVPAESIDLQRYSGGTWSTVGTATAADTHPGQFSCLTAASTKPALYRFSFQGRGRALSRSVSATITVKPTAAVTLYLPSTARSLSKFGLSAVLRPAHGKVTFVVQKRSRSGSYSTIKRLSVSSGGDRARTTLRLSRGTYRVRVEHSDSGHSMSRSVWKKVSVR